MAEISAKLVKELRERTGAGMMDCKKALVEAEGDMDRAIDWLKEKGIAKAAKKADRIAAEGLTTVLVEGNTAAVVELNSETDFVAKNVEFQELLATIAKAVVAGKPADMAAANALVVDGVSIETLVAEKVGKIGEKLSFRRFTLLEKGENEVFGAYSHMGGKIASLVKVAGATAEQAKDVAMQVAALNPAFLNRESVRAEVLAHEKEIMTIQTKEDPKMAGKPDQVLAKIVEGKVAKYYKENCLVEQQFVKDDKVTVQEYLGKAQVVSMVRYEVGEGMEKREEDFAAEVMAQMKG